jgi:hypothetical protein
MIRHRRGNEFLLITQDDHAIASSEMAKHLGNGIFATPIPYQPTLTAIRMHDSGWPLHDSEPTLDSHGFPLHVLECPPRIATRVWSESAIRAAELGDYAGLLVSLHVLHLSARWLASGQARTPSEIFELNKFQHRQIEIQEAIRKALEMRTDLPLELGLAGAGRAPDEDLLLVNFSLLRAMDALSLDACCSEPVFQSIDGIFPRPQAVPISIRVHHPAEFTLGIDPWPFNVDRIEIDVSARRVSAKPFASLESFHDAYRSAPIGLCPMRVIRQK